MNCFEMVATNSEQVLYQTVYGQKSLGLLRRFETAHLTLLLAGMLVLDVRHPENLSSAQPLR